MTLDIKEVSELHNEDNGFNYNYQRKCFRISEPLLDAHEAEVARLREFYDRRMKVFLALENWHQLWDQFVDFEKRANDPNRFSKRGGGLLQV